MCSFDCHNSAVTKEEIIFSLIVTVELFFKSGGHLFSHIVSNIVPSAAYVLTVVFGMGTGVSHKRITTRNVFGTLAACTSVHSALGTKTVIQPLLVSLERR